MCIRDSSQGEGLHFGRGTKSLRCSLRRLFGRRRKSRRAEVAGRRNSPEAVPNEKGGMETLYKLKANSFLGNGRHNPHGTLAILASPAGGLRTSKAQCIASWGWPCGRRQTEEASPMSRIVGSRRREAKGETRRTAGTRRFDFA